MKLDSHDNKDKHSQKNSLPLLPWFGVIIVINLNYCKYFHMLQFEDQIVMQHH